jgi:hypothetical protein
MVKKHDALAEDITHFPKRTPVCSGVARRPEDIVLSRADFHALEKLLEQKEPGSRWSV